jgi:heavy metal sensor kinase
MMHWWRRRSVRMSLTLWYGAVMIFVLAVYAADVFVFVGHRASKSLGERLRIDFRLVAEMADLRPDGTLVWFAGDDGSGTEDSPWLQIWSPDHQVLLRSPFAERVPIRESAWLAGHADDAIHPVRVGAVTFRVLSGRADIGGRPVIIQVAGSEEPAARELRSLALIMALALPLAVIAAAVGGYALSCRALAPLEHMAERARQITARRLSDRLPVNNPADELGRLATVFNDMLGTLESAFAQMQRFSSDVSHQLRTPLAAIRSVGDVGLRGRRGEAEYRGIIGSMLEEVERLACLVDRLLVLSRSEARQTRLSVDLIDLGGLADEVAAHLAVLAEDKRQLLRTERLGQPRCFGDRLVLRHALINLLDNAIKYTPERGQILVRACAGDEVVTIDVCDTGTGVPVEFRAQLFDRYSRAHRSSPDSRGAGLGLAIARSAVEACGGQLSLENSRDAGSVFRMTLPVAPEQPLQATG